MNDAQVLERLSSADPYPPTTELPNAIWTASDITVEVERRITMTGTKDQQTPTRHKPATKQRGLLVAAAAFLVVLLLGSGIWALLVRNGDTEVVDTPPTTTSVDTTEAAPTTQAIAPVAPEFGLESALAAADRYFAAIALGDSEAAREMLAPDAVLELMLDHGNPDSGPIHFSVLTNEDWENEIAWNAAQQALLTEPSCAVADETPGASYQLTCDYEYIDAIFQVVDAPIVPVVATIVVTTDGISKVRDTYGPPIPWIARSEFLSWIERTYPAERDVICCPEHEPWVSQDEGREAGQLYAARAQEWAEHLIANGCTYRTYNC